MPPAAVDKSLAAAIRRQRVARGYTQEQVAHAAGVTIGTYGQIERGRVNPTWTTAKDIARGLGVTPAELAALAERGEV